MRTIKDHIVEGDSSNHQLMIDVLDGPGAGGACHAYRISWSRDKTRDEERGVQPDTSYQSRVIDFQNGPIKEFGVNGLTQESLLAIVIDRLRSFQAGPFASIYNRAALDSCETALAALQCRTRERLARGVEGTAQA